MFAIPGLDPAIANAAYLDLRAGLCWMFADLSEGMCTRCGYALTTLRELRPASALEARLAVQVVSADVHANDALRRAGENNEDVRTALKCRNQAAAMLRQMARARKELAALQQRRSLGEGASDGMAGRPGGTGPSVRGSSADIRAAPACSETVAQPREAEAAAAQAEAAPAAAQAEAVANAARAAAPAIAPTALAKAEQFIAHNRMLAARVRHAGGVTPPVIAGFRRAALPSDPAVIAAIVYGTGPAFEVLDRMASEQYKVA